MSHRFTIGENVRYTPNVFVRDAVAGSYIVIRQLPVSGDEHQYRIKSTTENFERVVRESELELEGAD